MSRRGFSVRVRRTAVLVGLSAFAPVSIFAQQAQTLVEAQNQAAVAQVQRDAAQLRAESVAIELKATKIDTSSRKKFSESTLSGWAWLHDQCNVSPITDQCAASAIQMASNQCAASAKFLKKDTKSWQYLSFGLLMASAAFTGVGAASTLAGSTVVPKVFSTLGGTTGLGTAVAAANTNVSSDQGALLSINTTLNQFITYVTTGSPKGAASPPGISPNLQASAVAGVAFSYQIVATNSPTSFLVYGLPTGLTASASTGKISGTPTAGTSTITLQATNASGTSSIATLTLNVANAAPTAVPTINSAAAASGTVGSQFGYQISAINSPTGYGVATGSTLPAGLTLDAPTGLITGTPTTVGTTPVSLTATNAVGTSAVFPVTFNFVAAPPPGNGPAPNDTVYKVSSLYATQCAAAALNSSSK
jgi:hypothetical protein